MKLTVKQTDLSKGLSTVAHAVSSRSTLPILANILVSTDQGKLKLSATNLEIGINCLIDAEIIEDGTTTLPSKTLIDLVNSLRPGQVELTAEEGSFDVRVKSTGSNAMIKGMSPEEFPQLPTAEGDEKPIILDAVLLKDMIAQVVMAAATDDSRPVLAGVLVEVEGNQVTFNAADAFRLARRTATMQGADMIQTLLIPAKTLSELARILPNEGQVQMVMTPNRSQVLFHTEHIDLVSRLIEGTFPNIKAAMPKEHTTRVVVATDDFKSAVKTVMPFARDSSNIVRIKAYFDDDDATGYLTLESNAEDVGNNVTTIPATIDGDIQEVIFNVKYVLDVLAQINTSHVALELVSAARPGVIKQANKVNGEFEVDDSYTYVIMPMSVNR